MENNNNNFKSPQDNVCLNQYIDGSTKAKGRGKINSFSYVGTSPYSFLPSKLAPNVC